MKFRLASMILCASLILSSIQLPVVAKEGGQTEQTVSGNEIAAVEETDKQADMADTNDTSDAVSSTDEADGQQSNPEGEEQKGDDTLSDNEVDSFKEDADSSKEMAEKKEEDTQAAEEEEPICSCKEQCSKEHVDKTCSVCALEKADLTACMGKPVIRVVSRSMALTSTSSTIYVGGYGLSGGIGSYDNPYLNLIDAVANAKSGDTIIIKSSGGFCNDPTGYDGPLIISKSLTIKGESNGTSLTMNAGSIVLEADATLENFQLYPSSSAFKGIFANGYTLNMNNITKHSNALGLIDVYAGALNGSNVQSGSHGRVNISGNSQVKVVSGGSRGATWANASTITINGSVNIETGIIAGGFTDDNYGRNATIERVDGDVTISLTNTTRQITVNGNQNNEGTKKPEVILSSTGISDENLTLSNIRKLVVEGGTFILSALNESLDVSVKNGAVLDLSKSIEQNNLGIHLYANTFVINNLEGGGTVQFNQNQALRIEGTVSGVTRIHTNTSQGIDYTTSGIVLEDQVYVNTKSDISETAFTFVPNPMQENDGLRLVKNVKADGRAEWSFSRGGSTSPSTPKQDLSSATVAAIDGFTYDGTAKTPQESMVTVTLAGVTIPSTAYTISASNNIDAGQAAITIKANDSSNYTGTATGTFTISPRPITATAKGQTIFYGQKTTQPTWEITNGTLIGQDTLTGTAAIDSARNKISQGTLAAPNSNYTLTFNEADITVQEATPIIDITSDHIVQQAGKDVQVTVKVSNPYDSALKDCGIPTLTYQIGNGTKEPLTNGSFTIPKGTPKDTIITVEATTTQISGKYAAKTASMQITVTDKTVVDDKITLDAGSLVYGTSPDFKAQFTSTVSGTPKWTYTYSADHGSSFKALEALQNSSKQLPAGTYQVKVHYEDDGQIGEIIKTFEVTKKPLVIGMNVSGVTKTYDGTTKVEGTKPTLSLKNMVTGETPILDERAVTYTYQDANAGSNKTIRATNLTLTDTEVNKNYTVPATATASGATILPGEIDLSFTSDVSSQKAGETVNLTITAKNKSGSSAETGYLSAITVTAGNGDVVNMESKGNGIFTGTYSIPTGKQAGDNIMLKAVTKDNNYKDTAAELTIVVAETTVTPPANPDSGKTEIKTNLDIRVGISQVPDSLKTALNITTSQELESIMRTKITEKGNISAANTAVYDVTLMISTDGGKSWQKATKDNFPKGGVEVVLPYPDGTGKNTHNFTVVHMFTQEMNGHKAGEIETPAVTKDDAGVRFTVTGLSPISLGWKGIEQNTGTTSPSTPTPPPSSGGNSGQQGQVSNTGNGETNQSSSFNNPPSTPHQVYNEEEFWKNIERVLRGAKDGDTVKTNAGGYNYMPSHVMKTLKERGTIALEVSWNGGGTFTIPAGKALDASVERYALAELEKTDFSQLTTISQQSQASTAGNSTSTGRSTARKNSQDTAKNTTAVNEEGRDASVETVLEDTTETSGQTTEEEVSRKETPKEETETSISLEDIQETHSEETDKEIKQEKKGSGMHWPIMGGLLLAVIVILIIVGVRKGNKEEN